MSLYYFDVREGDHFGPDTEGVELPSAEVARTEAARTLAEMARDVLPGQVRGELAVEVSDDARKPLFRAVLLFGVECWA